MHAKSFCILTIERAERPSFQRAELVVNREGFCSAPIIQKKKIDTNILFLSSAVFGNPCLAQASQDVRGQSAKTLRCFFRLPADACMGSMTIPCYRALHQKTNQDPSFQTFSACTLQRTTQIQTRLVLVSKMLSGDTARRCL
jgi:hypothetical protein